MDGFDPLKQNVSFYAADGTSQIQVPIPFIDEMNENNFSTAISYATQIGACFIMLIILLIMTPSSKLIRPSNILQIAALVVCMIRSLLLSLYWVSPFYEFYRFFSEDFSTVPAQAFAVQVAGNTLSIFLVTFLELALINQAWTVVSVWTTRLKYSLLLISVMITMHTIGWRLAFVVLQNESIVQLSDPKHIDLVSWWMVVSNSLSIFYFCVLFNLKIGKHLVQNRGVLPSYKTLTPMEVLVVASGLLMIIPGVFAGLEWAHLEEFEPGSLTLTSVALILPMGSLAAQRMARTSNTACCSHCTTLRGFMIPGTSSTASATGKQPSFSTSSRSGLVPQVSITSRCETERLDPIDLELYHIDGQVRVDQALRQHVDRIK